MPLPSHIISSRADLEEVSRRRAIGVYYGEYRLLCRLLGDFLAFVDIRDLMVGPRLVLDGFWEAWVTLAIARHLRPGMWCVDVGANYGYYTLLMAAGCGPTGRVLACEPNPFLAETFLSQNLMLNGFQDRAEICRKAVGNINHEQVNFVLRDNDYVTSSLDLWVGPYSRETIKVSIGTLDQICASWEYLDLIKIDVEGAEALVWEGMQAILRRFPFITVIIELHLHHGLPQVISFLHQIKRDGFPLRAISYEGEIVPIEADTILAQPQEHWALWLQR